MRRNLRNCEVRRIQKRRLRAEIAALQRALPSIQKGLKNFADRAAQAMPKIMEAMARMGQEVARQMDEYFASVEGQNLHKRLRESRQAAPPQHPKA